MTSSPCASTHASATCPAVAPCFAPTSFKPSTSLRIFGKLAALYRGTIRLKSSAGKSSGLFCVSIPQSVSIDAVVREPGAIATMTYELSGKQSAAERRVCDNLDPELAGCFQKSDLRILNIKREDAVFDLKGGDGMHGMRATERCLGAFRDSKVLYSASSMAMI